MARSRWTSLAGLLLLVALFVAAGAIVSIGKKTHLGVPVGSIANAVTAGLVDDDNTPVSFNYDNGDAFTVPLGFSFVVTDIFIRPDASSAGNGFFLVSVKIGEGGSRDVALSFEDNGTHHTAFAGGMVMPGGTTPSVRNLPVSTDSVSVQILGYFVKGNALPENLAVFPVN